MTVRDVAESLGLTVCAGESALETEVSGGIVCDLLSVVMSHAAEGALWITVQTHPNVVAVAQVARLAGIVVAHGFEPECATLLKAQQEGMPLLTTPESSFVVAGGLYDLGAR